MEAWHPFLGLDFSTLTPPGFYGVEVGFRGEQGWTFVKGDWMRGKERAIAMALIALGEKLLNLYPPVFPDES